MPTVVDLDRLQALIAKLIPLSTAKPGEPLLAQTWNTAISVLIELLQVVLASEKEQVVIPHSHEEQVSSSWLDARLRTLVESGPLSDPTSQRKLYSIDRKTERLFKRLDEHETFFDELRKRVSEVATRDLVRESSVTEIGRRVDVIKDARDDVVQLRKTLDSIKKDIATVLEAAEKFKIDNTVADLKEFNARINSLEELKERLRMPSGDLLDAALLSKWFEEMKGTFVTEEELNEALKKIFTDTLDDQRFKELRDDLYTSLKAEIMQDKEKIAAEIKDHIIESMPEINEQIQKTVHEKLGTIVQTEVTKVFQELPSMISSTVKTELSKEIAGMKDNLVTTISKQVVDKMEAEGKVTIPSDDLARIDGIGETYSQRLKTAHINSFTELASLTPDQLGKILGISAERVMKYKFIEQAKELANMKIG